jgi:SAM-dependent methyltransferase
VAALTGAVAVDVGPFRRAPRIPYVVYDGWRLPFRDGAFDTTLMLLMLHHCERPDAVIAEAVRVTRERVLVTESVYRNRVDLWWLRRLDRPLNRLRHGGSMPGPRGFRRAEEWLEWFAEQGLAARETRWLGSRWERLVHHPVLFVLEREGGEA